jgi:hypothetical protein
MTSRRNPRIASISSTGLKKTRTFGIKDEKKNEKEKKNWKIEQAKHSTL